MCPKEGFYKAVCSTRGIQEVQTTWSSPGTNATLFELEALIPLCSYVHTFFVFNTPFSQDVASTTVQPRSPNTSIHLLGTKVVRTSEYQY